MLLYDSWQDINFLIPVFCASQRETNLRLLKLSGEGFFFVLLFWIIYTGVRLFCS